jgi:excisionase family DNA binding protein
MILKPKEKCGGFISPLVFQTVAPNSTTVDSPFRLAFSVKETADILGLSEKTIRRLIARRLLRSSRALRHLLIPRKEIERFLDQTTVI